ncbi:MAG: rRNA maturation RNase YbeY [Deltaproteobacteria bacterium]|nr:rRNA maturation RNase YbeY [Deltaproteobacteria bacterium]
MPVSLVDDQELLAVNQLKVKRRLGKALKNLGRPQAHISILFTTDEGIKTLNRDFRGIDKSTNVLAFPDTDEAIGQAQHLGDLALSTETIVREAAESQCDPEWMMYFYLTHGLLHLVGHDHELGPRQDKAQQAETERLMELIYRK